MVAAATLGAPLESARAQVTPAVGRGDSLMTAFLTAAAVEAYRADLARDPRDPTLLWKASLALSSYAAETPGLGGDEEILEEAVALARRAVAAGPEASRAHIALAVALGRSARTVAYAHRIARAGDVIRLGREAHAEALRAGLLDPSDFAPHIFLGVWHRELATVHPLARAVARMFLGGYPDASLADSEGHLLSAIRLAPANVTARLELGRTYDAMGRVASARRELEAAIALPARSELDRIGQQAARERLTDLR